MSPFQRAIEKINSLVSQGKQGDRLPSIIVLARQAKVSYVTMWRAIRECSIQGILETRGGALTRIRSKSTLPLPAEKSDHSAADTLPKWMRVFRQINRLFLEEGTPPDGRLPGIKELAGRCGVSRPTVIKAIQAMRNEGWVVAHGRGYRIKEATLHQGPSTLVLFTRVLRQGTQLTEKANDGIRILQDECARRGILLRNVQYVQTATGLVPLQEQGESLPRFSKADTGAILGFMIWTLGLEGMDLDKLTTSLHQTGRPVVVLDETGDFLERPGRPRLSRVRCFSLSYPSTAGHVMARYLLHNGHRNVAYITSGQPARWTQNRLRGVRDVFNRTGDPGAVRVITYPPADLSIDHEANFRAVYSVTTARGINKDHLRAFMSAIRRMEDPLQVETNNAVTSTRVAQACLAMEHDHGITAWIGENDVVAIACLDALPPARRKGNLIAGFDDSRAALERSLTSYNFGMDRVVRAMVAAVVDPGMVVAGRRGVPVEIEGAVIVR